MDISESIKRFEKGINEGSGKSDDSIGKMLKVAREGDGSLEEILLDNMNGFDLMGDGADSDIYVKLLEIGARSKGKYAYYIDTKNDYMYVVDDIKALKKIFDDNK